MTSGAVFVCSLHCWFMKMLGCFSLQLYICTLIWWYICSCTCTQFSCMHAHALTHTHTHCIFRHTHMLMNVHTLDSKPISYVFMSLLQNVWKISESGPLLLLYSACLKSQDFHKCLLVQTCLSKLMFSLFQSGQWPRAVRQGRGVLLRRSGRWRTGLCHPVFCWHVYIIAAQRSTRFLWHGPHLWPWLSEKGMTCHVVYYELL